LDTYTDNFKREVFFKAEDIIFDPFSSVGTTLVEVAELRMNAIRMDIAAFNALIR
jgi:DNA modification methylase